MKKLALIASSIVLTSCRSPADVSQRDALIRHLTALAGQFEWHVSERLPDGRENRQCFMVPHGGTVIYWPSHHSLSFALIQGGQERKTLIASFAAKPEHDVIFNWDQTAETVGLFVDGKPAQALASKTKKLSCPF
ncbi:MAG TPA: hypothetical protein VGU01_01555 [Sphingomicrobium sp.]|nr:hypothetical protein [Sphingomicrobium sp.]